jgi:uncharacterized membrane protein YqaE (UPF0057 family)
MKYFFAIFLPPVAVLLCGKPGSFLLNLILTLCGWVPGVVHAIMVVGSYNADKRTDRIVDALSKSASGVPALPQAANQGRSMKFMLFAGGVGFVLFCALAVAVAGLGNRMPSQADKLSPVAEEAKPVSLPKPDKPASVEQSKPVAVPAADNKLPAYTIISDESNRTKKWRTVKIRLQEKFAVKA